MICPPPKGTNTNQLNHSWQIPLCDVSFILIGCIYKKYKIVTQVPMTVCFSGEVNILIWKMFRYEVF